MQLMQSEPLDLGMEALSLNYWLGGNSHKARIIRSEQAREQRQRASMLVLYWIRSGWVPAEPPIVVTLARVMGPKQRAFDADNLAGGLKHIRDGIADAYRIDDVESELVQWDYRQERGDRATTMVTVEARKS